jgi:hypothetical protein
LEGLSIKGIRDLASGVFEGGRLHEAPPPYPVKPPILCRLTGREGGQICLEGLLKNRFKALEKSDKK